MFSPGEPVRLLNDAVEGVVISIHSGDTVEIRDTDGFKRIAKISELVRIEFRATQPEAIFDSEKATKDEVISAPSSSLQQVKTRFVHSFSEDEAIYALLSLADPNAPLNAEVECWIVNATDFNLSMVFAREVGEMRQHAVAAQVAARSEIKLCSIPQQQLYMSEGFEVQLLLYRDCDYRPRIPLVKRFNVRPDELLEIASRKSKVPADNAVKKALAVLREQEVDVGKLIDRFSAADVVIDDSPLSQHRKRFKARNAMPSKERIVDLHIEELVKDHSGMSPAQIIAHQLTVFEKEMDRALIDHVSRITFIHGVGAGVLRSALREALKRFDTVKFGDAPPEKFGYGATQVELI